MDSMNSFFLFLDKNKDRNLEDRLAFFLIRHFLTMESYWIFLRHKLDDRWWKRIYEQLPAIIAFCYVDICIQDGLLVRWINIDAYVMV